MHGTVEELWRRFHKYIKRIMNANTEPQADFLQLKLVMREVVQDVAGTVDWFQEYWTSRKGRWTSAHADYGNSAQTGVLRVSSAIAKMFGLVQATETVPCAPIQFVADKPFLRSKGISRRDEDSVLR